MRDELTWEQELIIANWAEGMSLPEIIEEQDRRLDNWARVLEDRDAKIAALRGEVDTLNEVLGRTERALARIAVDHLTDADLVALLRGDEPHA